MKTINLTKGLVAKVSEEDFDYLNQWKWHFDGRYPARTAWDSMIKAERKVYMHRVIMEAQFVDHINGDKLDNRRENLRAVTKSQNNMNQSQQKKQKHSKYKGVSWDKSRNKWMAYCKKDGKMNYLGRFTDENEAALAYNNKASELFGEFAKLNEVE